MPRAHAGLRLDQSLAKLFPSYSRTRLALWTRAGRVLVDQALADPRRRLLGGEAIELVPDESEIATVDRPEALPLAIVYEDAAIIVIDKPVGLVVHPGSGVRSGTLLNALLAHEPKLESLPRAGIVHRLDKDTSGLLVVAKTLSAQTDLVRQLQARTVRREYLAVAHGAIDAGLVVDKPIGRDPRHRTRMAVTRSGREARTAIRVVERFGHATLIECALETGRTHQIRVHLRALGHPLVGDTTYGGQRSVGVTDRCSIARQALHATRLGLLHPDTHTPQAWHSPLPADMAALVECLRAVAGKAAR